MPTTTPSRSRLLPLRATVILVFALHVGAGAAALTHFSGGVAAPMAAVAGVGAFAATARWLHALVD